MRILRFILPRILLALLALMPALGITIVVVQPRTAVSTINFAEENFEGTFTDTAFTYLPVGWTATNKGMFYDDTAPLTGAQSLRCDGSGAFAQVSLKGAGDEITADMKVNYDVDGASYILRILSSSFADLASVILHTDGTLIVLNGSGVFEITAGATPAATPFYIRLHYKKGSGANAEVEVFWSLTTTFPSRGHANHAGVTNSTATGVPDTLSFSSTTSVLDFDNLEITSDAPVRKVICDGDSIMAGDGMDSPAIQLQASIGATYRVHNIAISAQKLDDMMDDDHTQYLPYGTLWNRVEKPVLIIYELVNQALVSTAAQCEAKYWTLADAAQAAGFYVIVCTTFHNDDTLPGGVGQVCEDASALIRANYAGHADALAEFDIQSLRDDAAIGGSGDEDDIHPGPTGWAIMAGILDDLVLAAP